MNRYENLIGNALAYPYGGWGAAPVFGADAPGPMPAAPLAPPGAPPGFGVPAAMMGAGCWGEAPCVNPCFDQRRLFSAILGENCGPLLQQLPMPFEDVGCIDDGEEVDIRAFPQYWSKLVRLFLSPSQASSFQVTGIFAGITPVMVSQGILPGEMFLPDSENVLFNSVTLFPNQPFILRVKNISGAQAKCNPGAVVMAVSGGLPQIYGTPLGGL